MPVAPRRAPRRLRSSREVRAVLRSRCSRADDLVTVCARPTEGPGAAIAVIASRSVGPAVRRNRAKRLLREAARQLHWRNGTAVVLVARGACAAADLHVVRAAVAHGATRLDVLEVGA